MNTKRTLRLRKEVLTSLADAELELVPGGGQEPAMPESFPTLCDRTCLTCNWTCLCIHQ